MALSTPFNFVDTKSQSNRRPATDNKKVRFVKQQGTQRSLTVLQFVCTDSEFGCYINTSPLLGNSYFATGNSSPLPLSDAVGFVLGLQEVAYIRQMALTMNGFPGFGHMEKMDSTADIDRLLEDDSCDFGSSSESSSAPVQHEDDDTCEFVPAPGDVEPLRAVNNLMRDVLCVKQAESVFCRLIQQSLFRNMKCEIS